jgi:hypothetical protein
MRWFKIHVSATLIILAGWCMHDATLKNEHGWVVAMALIVMLSIYNLSEAICND